MIITNTRSSTHTYTYAAIVQLLTVLHIRFFANRAVKMSNSRLRKVFAHIKVHFFIVCLDYPDFAHTLTKVK